MEERAVTQVVSCLAGDVSPLVDSFLLSLAYVLGSGGVSMVMMW